MKSLREEIFPSIPNFKGEQRPPFGGKPLKCTAEAFGINRARRLVAMGWGKREAYAFVGLEVPFDERDDDNNTHAVSQSSCKL